MLYKERLIDCCCIQKNKADSRTAEQRKIEGEEGGRGGGGSRQQVHEWVGLKEAAAVLPVQAPNILLSHTTDSCSRLWMVNVDLVSSTILFLTPTKHFLLFQKLVKVNPTGRRRVQETNSTCGSKSHWPDGTHLQKTIIVPLPGF